MSISTPTDKGFLANELDALTKKITSCNRAIEKKEAQINLFDQFYTQRQKINLDKK